MLTSLNRILSKPALALVIFFALPLAMAQTVQPTPTVLDPKKVDFLGSSSIQFWQTIKTDFPQVDPVNLGVWGTDFSDLLADAPRLLRENPATRYVIYSGDNDIAAGSKAEDVVAKFEKLEALIHSTYPQAKIFLISIKPCPVPDRRQHIPEVARTNSLLKNFTAFKPSVTFVDVFPAMLTAEGEPRAELFQADGLHMNEKGYALWANALRPLLNN